MKYPTSSVTATSCAPTPSRPESDPSKLLSDVVVVEVGMDAVALGQQEL